MSEVLHANIFFFIASVATILFTVLLCIALYHVIKILKSLRIIMKRVEEGSEVIAEDLESIRAFVLEGGLISRIIGMAMGVKARGSRRKKKAADED